MATEIRFEQWELDDLNEAARDLEHKISISYSPGHDDRWFQEFLNRVVEVADAHRSRQAIKDAPHAKTA